MKRLLSPPVARRWGNSAERWRERRPADLGAVVIKDALLRAKVEAAMVDDVIMGADIDRRCTDKTRPDKRR